MGSLMQAGKHGSTWRNSARARRLPIRTVVVQWEDAAHRIDQWRRSISEGFPLSPSSWHNRFKIETVQDGCNRYDFNVYLKCSETFDEGFNYRYSDWCKITNVCYRCTYVKSLGQLLCFWHQKWPKSWRRGAPSLTWLTLAGKDRAS